MRTSVCNELYTIYISTLRRSIYMELLVSSIISIITEFQKDAFFGIKGKIRIIRLKKKLKQSISREILNKYGNEVFYNDLDHFLTDNDVICNIIRNCINTSVFDYQSKGQTVLYYVQLFIEQHPRYSRYHYEIRFLIQKYFEVIYNTLNESNNDETRIICNLTKELAYELSTELLRVEETVNSISKKVDSLINTTVDASTKFFFDKYCKYLLCLYPSYTVDTYLQRKLYANDDTEDKIDSLDILLKEKKILVLGEAGFGKTYESIILLNKACKDERVNGLIPIYFPLHEYGLLYSDIVSGIKYKVSPFSEGKIESLIAQWLKAGKIIFIFDGIDDITQEDARTKFFAEINNISAQYANNYFFFTSRFNRYHGGLGEQKRYSLTALDEQIIRQELRNEGIIVNIPNNYYKLFTNPFFLSVGKTVLKQSNNSDIFNRSRLFDELFLQLYGGLEQKKGFGGMPAITYDDAISILGRFAYETFTQPSCSYLEFDQRLSKIITANKASIISSFISSGLFKVSDNVSFVHKLFKEYCTAHFLINNYPLSENIDLYTDLVNREEWKEVFVFAGGLYKEINTQDEFLDFIISNNLPLYIECVNTKSDLNIKNNHLKPNCIAKRLLMQIHKTYTFIVSHYFNQISNLFDPQCTKEYLEKYPNIKVGIVGCLSDDESWLSYWFDIISANENEVNCINAQQSLNYHKEFEKKALFERRNIYSYGVNLRLSGLQGDSGRKIAIDLIKRGLNDIINKKRLIESKYLLCERVSCYQQKLKILKDSNDLIEMQDTIDELISKALQEIPDIEGYNYNGVELFDLQKLLHYLNNSKTNLPDFILPGPDKLPSRSGSCFTWDLYSKEQKQNRIALFFYYHELSYLDMVINNFPKLYDFFSRYKDIPYQVIVAVNYKENSTNHDFYSEPAIQYYYIAAPSKNVPMPELLEHKGEFCREEYDQIIKQIQESYLKQGRKVHKLTSTQTGFTFTTTSR